MKDALQVFDEIPQPDVVSWNTMIGGYFVCGFGLDAFICYQNMLFCGVVPDKLSFTSVLKGCTNLGNIGKGLQVHCNLIKLGLGDNVFVGSALVEFYAEFHCFDESAKVFNSLEFKDIVLINAMIGVHTKNGNSKEAFANLREILSSSLVPTRATFVNVLSGIDGYEILRGGVQIHGLIIKFGFEDDGVIENSLVGMYSSCDAMDDAFDLLVYLGSKNIMSWTTLINGYAIHACFQDAMDAFYWIYHEAMVIDDVLLACILSVSAVSESLDLGTQIHSVALQIGCESDICVREALMDMYAKCSTMEDTRKIFEQISHHRDLVLWTTLISGNVHNGFSVEALRNFYQMQKEGINPDLVVCISVLMGCIDLKAIDHGKQIHAYTIKFGCNADISVQTTLLSLYSECGNINSTLKLFGKISSHDVTSWTALISGYAKLGYSENALALLIKMLEEGFKPNHFTLATALAACSKLTATETGKLLHSYSLKIGLENDKFVGTALIDMYSKCGSIENSVSYFMGTSKSDIVLWNALLSGHAHHGNGLEVLKAFDEMKNYGVKPDEITFLAVLSGCSHGNLVDRAVHYFFMMHDYGVSPEKEHYACVIDGLGRSGLFREAVEFIEGMGFEPGIVVLRTLLSSCIVHRHIQLGLAVVAKLVELGDNDTATYVLLSNLYAADGRWEDARKVREVMEKFSRGKKVGMSWIEVKAVY
ncbi:pentatricopeptide repeat-containing protein At4g39530-like [Tasmannia lanceolata]|uniref:pentatricopeptide repeat-containing protein At4g39530-like n=1 Tax=Tasmannia lanceolata TaxID=3420 RepID=UPI0040628AF3